MIVVSITWYVLSERIQSLEQENEDLQRRLDKNKENCNKHVKNLENIIVFNNVTMYQLGYDAQNVKDNLILVKKQHNLCEEDKDKCLMKDETLQQEVLRLRMEVVILEANMSVCLNANETCQRHLESTQKNLQEYVMKYTACLKESEESCDGKNRQYVTCQINLEKYKLQLQYVTDTSSVCQEKLNKCWFC